MESVREYLVSVTCAGILAGILCSLTDDKYSGGALLKLLCGVFLSLVILSPLSHIDFRNLDLWDWDFREEGEAAAAMGQEYAQQAKSMLIKKRTEAYILDKASLYNLDITVAVTVSHGETPVPESVEIRGRASPYARLRLQQMMESELSIPKENQRWMDSYSG